MSDSALALIGIGSSLVCFYAASLYSNRRPDGEATWIGIAGRTIFILFGLLFLLSANGASVNMALVGSGNLTESSIVTAAANSLNVSGILIWVFIAFLIIGLMAAVLGSAGKRVF